MATRKVFSYPAHSINKGIVDALHSLTDFIKGPFPEGFFKFTHVNTQSGLLDIHREKYPNVVNNTMFPRFKAEYELNSLSTDDSGNGKTPYKQYPSQMIDMSMRSYSLIFRDKFDIRVYTNDIRIKLNVNFTIEVNSRDDQISTNTYLLNFLRFGNGYRVEGIKAGFLLPNQMILSIKNLVYGKDVLISEIQDEFAQCLSLYSGNRIKPLYQNGNSNRDFYKYIKEYPSVYLQLSDEPQLSRGDMIGMVYEKFSITFSGFVEIGIPISYIFNTPDFICGNFLNNDLIISSEYDKNLSTGVMTPMETSKDLLNRSHIDKNEYTKIYYEEFTLSDTVDTVDIKEWLPDEDKAVAALISTAELKTLYRVIFFENDHILDEGDYVTIDDSFVAHITGGDVTALCVIEIYRKDTLFKSIKSRLGL